jgi:hypothetical protein
MEFDKKVRMFSRKLRNGESYREIREELLDSHYPEDALEIATESYRIFKKERVKSSFKSIAIGVLLLSTTAIIAPPSHAYKTKITIALLSFLLIKTAYDWYQIRKSEKEYLETEPQF